MPWTVETLNDTVDQELAALPVDLRARFVRIANLIEEFGLGQVERLMSGIYREPYGKSDCGDETVLPEPSM
jgi:hypothetical protein